MGADLGSIYTGLEMRIDKFEASVTKALQGFYKLQTGTVESSKIMDKSVYNAINNIDKEMKIWELRNASTESSFSKLMNKVPMLEKEISLLDKEISKSDKIMADLETNFGKNSQEVENFKSHVLDLKLKQEELRNEMSKTITETSTLTGKFRLLSQEYQSNLEKMALLAKAGDSMKSIGTTMTYSVTAPVVGLGVAVSKTAMDFEAGMSKVKAISGATGDELKILNDQAMKLGADTVFSASEAAEGMQNLASAGFSVNEVYSAMPGMLSLAASGDIEIADAADIASSALRGFGLDATQSGHVADVLAKAAADTNAEVTDMGYSLKYAAAPAHALGLSLEETASAIGTMANAGIKGEQAGTTLRGALTRLVNPSEDAAKTMDKLNFSSFDSQGKMKSLSIIIGEFTEKTKNLTDEQKQQAVANIFGQESMSGMLVLMDQGEDTLDELTTSFKDSDGAATDMANTMQDNTKGAIEQMKGSLETAGIKLGTVLAPAITEIANDVTDLANKFSELNPETQTMIVKSLTLAAAMGPVLMVSGSLISSFAKITAGGRAVASMMGLITTATTGVGTASTVAAGAAGAGGVIGLGGSFAGLIAAAAPWLLGVTAVTGTGYLIYKAMTQEAIPAVNLFGDAVQTTGGKIMNANEALAQGAEGSYYKISDATQKAVSAYMELDKKAVSSLNSLYVNSTTITAENSKALVNQYSAMNQQIQAGMDNQYQNQLKNMQDFFAKSNLQSDIEETEILKKMQEGNANKKTEEDKYVAQIQAILQKASDEKRALTLGEQQQINLIQETMKTNAVKALSDQEVESKIILERLKDYGARITAEQASEEIKNAEKARKESVDQAEQKYQETMAAIIRERDESKTITKDQSEKMIAEAKRQRDESISKADELKKGVVDKITSMNSSISSNVDTTTGKMITAWDKFGSGVKNAISTGISWIQKWNEQNMYNKTGSMTISQYTKALTGSGDGYASGTDYATRGWHLVGEEGPEIMWFDGGEKVMNANETRSALNAVAGASTFAGSGVDVGSWYSAGVNQDAEKRSSGNIYNNESNSYNRPITQKIVINSPKALNASEIVRKQKQASKQLAMEWGG